MKIKLIYLFLISIFLIILINLRVGFVLKAEEKSVYINEFFPDPAGTDSGKEWIELYNSASNSINLNNWKIKNISSGGTVRTITLPEITLKSKEFLIIADSNGITIPENTNSQIIYFPLGVVNLFNSASKLELYDAQSQLIEYIDYSSVNENISLERKGPICLDFIKHSNSHSMGFTNQNDQSVCSPTSINNPVSYPITTGSISLTDSIVSFPVSNLPLSYPTDYSNDFKAEDIIITEVSASPSSGEKEWIEIYNNSQLNVDLVNYEIKDVNTQDEFDKKYTLSGILAPKTHLIFEPTTISLNNTGDRIGLFFKENLIDEVKYPNIIKGESYSRKYLNNKYLDEWFLTFYITKDTYSHEDIIDLIPITNLKVHSSGKIYKTRGCISIIKSVMPDNYGYMQDGISAIKFKVKDDSDLNIGDCLEATGKIIKTSKDIYFLIENYAYIDFSNKIIARELVDSLKIKDFEGQLVKLNNISISRKYTYSLLLSNDLKMKYPEDFNPEDYQNEDSLIIEGVIVKLSNNYYIYPFSIIKNNSILGISNNSIPNINTSLKTNIIMGNEDKVPSNESYIPLWIPLIIVWTSSNLIFFQKNLLKLKIKLDKFIQEKVKYLNAERTSYFGKEIFHRNFSKKISKT